MLGLRDKAVHMGKGVGAIEGHLMDAGSKGYALSMLFLVIDGGCVVVCVRKFCNFTSTNYASFFTQNPY